MEKIKEKKTFKYQKKKLLYLFYIYFNNTSYIQIFFLIHLISLKWYYILYTLATKGEKKLLL